jgi:anti-sigma B factor antagonist
MDLVVTSHDENTVLELSGRLDLNSSSQLKGRVKELLAEGKMNLVLDMSDVNFINSSGLGTLVSILKDVRMVKGRMVVCDLAQYVQEIFEITQLSHIFDIYPTVEEATRSFASATMNTH